MFIVHLSSRIIYWIEIYIYIEMPLESFICIMFNQLLLNRIGVEYGLTVGVSNALALKL